MTTLKVSLEAAISQLYASTLSDSDRDRDKFYVELQLYRYGASLPKSDMTIAGSNEIAVMNR